MDGYSWVNLFEVILMGATPGILIRGAIPVAILVLGIPWPIAFVTAFAGNALTVLLLLLGLRHLDRLSRRIKHVARFGDWIIKRSRREGGIIQRYKEIGIVVLVAIPVPGSGSTTGVVLAWLLGIPLWRALIAILLGTFVLGVEVTILTLMGWAGAVIAGVILTTFIVLRLRKRWLQHN